MADREKTRLSVFLSLVLRHQPEVIGLELDAAGWLPVDALLAACRAHGTAIDRALLHDLVATSPKQRFALSADGARIRASQGHSVDVELGYDAIEPPETLYHGTVASSLGAIRAGGLLPMERRHVHLSADATTARGPRGDATEALRQLVFAHGAAA